ncbi:MAG: lycopene cyclase domain-containing protein, partial [Sphingobacteriales bacterium]
MPETKFLYLLLLLFSLAYPLAQSFEHRIRYYRKWGRLLAGTLTMMCLFIPWDIWFAHAGVWWFSNDYIIGARIMGLPVEEWMFFMIVPFSCVFIYEVLNYYINRDVLKPVARPMLMVLMAFLIVVMYHYTDRIYTFVTSGITVFALLLVTIRNPPWLGRFLMAYLVCLIPFLLVNGALNTFNGVIQRWLPDTSVVLFTILSSIISFAVLVVIFGVIYKVLPDAKIKWKDVRAGAIFTALLFLLGRYIIGLYINSSGAGSPYGAAGSLIVVLLWVYYSAAILYFSAEFTRVYAAFKVGIGFAFQHSAIVSVLRYPNYFTLVLLMIFPMTAFAGIVKGKVTDDKGEALPFAIIFVKGTTAGTSANANGIPFDAVQIINLVPSGPNLNVTTSFEDRSRASYFARGGYEFKGRYGVDLSFRRDASSRYSPGSRWGTFPAASARWTISDEPFFDRFKDLVSFLKIRGSYGVTG